MNSDFKLVGVVVKPHQSSAAEMVKEIAALLERRGVETLFCRECASLLGGEAEGFARGEMMLRCDMVIVLGGDGTLLSLARHQRERVVPILGINLGHLGFLTEVAATEAFEQIESALDGRMRRSCRMMLASKLLRRGEAQDLPHVLNDVVINKSALARIFDVDILVDGQWVTNVRADGIIVSTPTGSTAYNLAANGPIVHPEMDVIIISPICPHTLTQRPVVLSGGVEVELRINNGEEIYLTMDGQKGFPISGGDVVKIGRSERRLCILAPEERDFFDVLRNKLNWGKRWTGGSPEERSE